MTINQKINSITLLINYLIFDNDKIIILIENIFNLNVILFIRNPDNNNNNDTNSKMKKMRKVL